MSEKGSTHHGHHINPIATHTTAVEHALPHQIARTEQLRAALGVRRPHTTSSNNIPPQPMRPPPISMGTPPQPSETGDSTRALQCAYIDHANDVTLIHVHPPIIAFGDTYEHMLNALANRMARYRRQNSESADIPKLLVWLFSASLKSVAYRQLTRPPPTTNARWNTFISCADLTMNTT